MTPTEHPAKPSTKTGLSATLRAYLGFQGRSTPSIDIPAQVASSATPGLNPPRESASDLTAACDGGVTGQAASRTQGGDKGSALAPTEDTEMRSVPGASSVARGRGVRRRCAPPPTRYRLAFATGCASLVVATTLLAGSAIPAAAVEPESCPNEERRTEQGAPGRALPDCRAYELVSPPGVTPWVAENSDGNEKDGTPAFAAQGAVASAVGNRFAFYTKGAAPAGSTSAGPYYLASREPSGWSTQGLIPPQSTDGGDLCNAYMAGYTPDLSKGILADGFSQQANEGIGDHGCGRDEPLLVPGEPEGFQNLFLRDNEAGTYQFVNLTPAGVLPNDAYFQAGSDDFSHIVFTENAPLTPEAPPTPPRAGGHFENLFELADGVVRLVTILPDGAPVFGLLVNGQEPSNHQGSAVYTHAISSDGERVFFYTDLEPSGEGYLGGKLYLREHAAREQSPLEAGHCTDASRACTVQVDLAESGAAGPSGHGVFQWASADGTKAFFTDQSQLTADSTAEAGRPDLYEYDLEAPEGERLTDLTVNAGEPAGVLGVSGVSEDGSYVYFAASGALTGSGLNSQGAAAEAGQPNLYLRHAGQTIFIATLLEGREADGCDWEAFTPPAQPRLCLTARVSPGGGFLAFDSLRSLTGYDNTDVNTHEPDQQIFLFDATSGELQCASCDPTGAPPTSPASIRNPQIIEQNPVWAPGHIARYLSDSGQVFFDTRNPLLPADVNGTTRDVYEYHDGQLSLISTGTSDERSFFYDAGASGNDVFLLTTQALVNSDTDNAMSLYDARVGGGFPEPPPPPGCEGEACHGPSLTPPSNSSSGTSNFQGPEEGPNHPQAGKCKEGLIKRHGRCVKPHRQKKHRRSHRRAGLNRGGER